MRAALFLTGLAGLAGIVAALTAPALEAQGMAGPTPDQMRGAVVSALQRECPQKAALVENVSCSSFGFDGKRLSCTYRLAKRFGTQSISVVDNGNGWRPENAFNLCAMPPLEIQYEPRQEQLVQAVRAACPAIAVEIGPTICTRQINAATDTYTCRYTPNGAGGSRVATDIVLERDRWKLVQPAQLCGANWAAERDRPRPPAPRPAAPPPPPAAAALGRYELSLAMRDTCPITSERLASARCVPSEADPTEFSCRFRVEGARDDDQTVIARDAGRWILIDVPESCS